MGKTRQAYLLLQNSSQSLESKYLLARCCLELGELREAEQALSGIKGSVVEGDIPGGAAGLQLMGVVCRRQHRREEAISLQRRAIEADPFLWSAISELNELGADANLETLLPLSAECAVDGEEEGGNEEEEGDIETELGRRAPLPTPRVSLSLGQSSISLRLPLPSPGSASPRRDSTTSGGNNNNNNSASRMTSLQKGNNNRVLFDTPGLTPIPMNTFSANNCSTLASGQAPQSSHWQPSHYQVNRALEFGTSTGGSAIQRDNESRQPEIRRVSFGPSARLSFASSILEEEEEEDLSLVHQPSSSSAQGRGAVDSDDFHPTKVMFLMETVLVSCLKCN